MNPIRTLINITAILFVMNNVYANQPAKTHHLYDTRLAVVQRYLLDLQTADYKDIIQLFDKNAIVVSTSQGKVNAKEFFYGFLSSITSAKTSLKQTFFRLSDPDTIAVRFHFNYKLNDGDEGSGEYADEFHFIPHSTMLSSVYMFENLKFPSDSE